MSEAMISGITAQDAFDPGCITVMNNSNQDRLRYLNETYCVSTTTHIQTLLENADIVILAVKPKDVFTALSKAKEYIRPDMLLISVIAGVSITSIEDIVNQKVAVIRTMPNTSAAVGKSATAIALNASVTDKQLQIAKALLETIGRVTIVNEEQLDAVTGLSGSGPAYLYYFIEAMEDAAAQIGLEKAAAKELILQTFTGAVDMLLHSAKEPEQLRKDVTSPGGTTEAGLNILEKREVKQAFIDCIVEATQQSKRLGQKISEEIKEQTLSI